MSFNQAVLIGDVGDDLRLRQQPSGEAELSFSVATDESFQGEPRKRLEWHRVVAIGSLAETCSKRLKAGTQIYVEGQLGSHKFAMSNQPGRPEQVAILASKVQVLGAAPKNQNGIPVPAENPMAAST